MQEVDPGVESEKKGLAPDGESVRAETVTPVIRREVRSLTVIFSVEYIGYSYRFFALEKRAVNP